MCGWISVLDQFPEEEKVVLVRIHEFDHEPMRAIAYYSRSSLNGSEQWYLDPGFYGDRGPWRVIGYPVTHWCTLPSVYDVDTPSIAEVLEQTRPAGGKQE